MRRFLLRSLAVLAVLAVPALAHAAPPNYDLLYVETEVTWPTANPGSANEGGCFVLNTTHGDVRTRIELQVEFADGKVERLTNTGVPMLLHPEDGFIVNVFFVVPEDAPLGPARFICAVSGVSLAGHGQIEREAQSSSFDVVP
ncbi:MAG TPA: hypothetical protein VFV75_15810 [Candidatus Polarisedimenticolaceae bacterium]|nr:hypothetical protein [Candidatus Polarisedimenticolaceae bacterium]